MNSLYKFILLLLLLPSAVSAVNIEDIFVVSGVESDMDFIPQRIAIIVFNVESLVDGDTLQINYLFNNRSIESICSHQISFSGESSIQKRVYCPIPVQDISGIYTARISLNRDSEQMGEEEIKFFYNSPSSDVTHQFRLTPQGTEVTINILNIGVEEPFDLYHSIPKSVISRLNYQNKDEFIISDLDFEIIQENPIISWQVSSREERIQYVLVDRELSEEEMVQFASYSVPKESGLNLIILFSILILLLIIFVPFFTKKK